MPYSSYNKGTFASSRETQTDTATEILASLPQIRPDGTTKSTHTLSSSFLSISHKEPDQKPILYSLVAVICHIGTAYGGHYVVYKKVLNIDKKNLTLGKEWVYVSDASWDWVSENEVLRQQDAYLLFYERESKSEGPFVQ